MTVVGNDKNNKNSKKGHVDNRIIASLKEEQKESLAARKNKVISDDERAFYATRIILTGLIQKTLLSP